MLIPLGTDRPLARATLVTHAIIGLNVAIFLADLFARGPVSPDAQERLGPIGQALTLSRATLASEPWNLVASAFVHGGIWHLLGNMIVLWVFGPSVEDRFGRFGFAIFYLAAAVASSGAYLLFSTFPVVGASGAIAAVTGAYAVLFPKTNIRCFLFFIFIGIYSIPALWFIGFAVARDLWGLGMNESVAREAHLGGYVFGFLIAFALLGTRILPREPYDMFQLFRQRRRRAEMRSALQGADQAAPVRAGAARPGAVSQIIPEEAVQLRAQVSGAIAAGHLDKAAEHYRTLADTYSAIPPAIVLSRQNMLLMANQFFAAGDHQFAARTYERFLESYPRDAELAHVKLMLGLIRSRYLNQPAKARPLIVEAAAAELDAQHAELARELLAEIDAASPV